MSQMSFFLAQICRGSCQRQRGQSPLSPNPIQHCHRVKQLHALRHHRARDHQDRHAQRLRRIQLRPRSVAAGVFADDKLCAKPRQQRAVACQIKRPARHHHLMTRQGRRRLRWVHKTQQIVMLRLCGEAGHLLSSNRQKHPTSRPSQNRNRSPNIRHLSPTLPYRPGRTAQRDQGHTCHGTGGHRIAAHPVGKGMRRVHHMGDAFCCQIGRQPVHPAKPANPHRHRLPARRFNPPGIGQNGPHTCVSHQPCKGRGVGRAAENKKVWAHG